MREFALVLLSVAVTTIIYLIILGNGHIELKNQYIEWASEKCVKNGGVDVILVPHFINLAGSPDVICVDGARFDGHDEDFEETN